LAKTTYDVKIIVLRKNYDEDQAMEIVGEKKTKEKHYRKEELKKSVKEFQLLKVLRQTLKMIWTF